MNNNFSNKRVLITGSSSGIGKEIAKSFIEKGAIVIVNGRNEKKLINTCDDIGAKHYVCSDVSTALGAETLILKAVEIIGGIDVLVCNVGNGKSVLPGEETFDEWQKVFGINFFSTTNVIEASKKHIIDSKGSIVCISSICGKEVIDGAPVTYSVAKSALNTYIKSISKFFGKKGVRINGIAPGNIIFPGSTWEKKLKNNKKNTQEMLLNIVPLNKFGKPEDIASLTLYLSSDKSNFVTGSIWTIDGGQVNSL